MSFKLSEYSIELLASGKHRRLENARKFFPDAMFEECVIEREYQSIPPSPADWVGLGAIPFDAESLLLLLRLFQPGDLAFVSLTVETPSGLSRQYPYRVISYLMPGCSTLPFVLNQSDIAEWEEFAAFLKTAPSWNSQWFEVSRRYFLYGGSTEFN
ncbi:MAG: hypothetical protein ACHP7I_07400, partial [Terriglobales bacterium]